jgi:hypothetical protein
MYEKPKYTKVEESLEAKLLLYGFTKNESAILDCYEINLSKSRLDVKFLNVTIEQGNQYISIFEGGIDEPRNEYNMVVVFNSDYDGPLRFSIVKDFYELIMRKKLTL